LIVSGVAVGLAWVLFVVRVGDRTVFGHARVAMSGKVGDAWARLKSGLDERLDELNGTTQDERKKKLSARAKAKALAEQKKVAAVKSKPAPTARPAASAKAAVAEKKRTDAQVDKLKQAESLARAMQRADAAPPPKKTKVDERISASGKARVDELLAED